MKASEFLYCSKCDQEIAPSNIDQIQIEQVDSICTNPLTGGYLDRYEYENVVEKYLLYKCPNCGKELKKLYLGRSNRRI